MNRYAAESILFHVGDGKRILIVERTGREVREALHEFQQVIAQYDLPAQVHVSRGAERIRLGTGWVRFATPRGHQLRGLSADVVFIDNEAHRALEGAGDQPRQFLTDAALVVNARGGEVVHS